MDAVLFAAALGHLAKFKFLCVLDEYIYEHEQQLFLNFSTMSTYCLLHYLFACVR